MKDAFGDCDIIFAPPDAERLVLGMRHLSSLKANGVDLTVALKQDPCFFASIRNKGENGAAVVESFEELVASVDSLIDSVDSDSEIASGEEAFHSDYGEGASSDDTEQNAREGGFPYDEPHGSFVCIDIGRMNSIVEISTESLLAVIEGGVVWRDVRTRLNEMGLYFPHWQSTLDENNTVAELVMRGEPARAEFAYGRLRDSILSVELVTPDGVLLKSGSRAVKDVSGYELIPFIMQYGARCGVVVRVVLKLLPRLDRRIFFAASAERSRIEKIADVIERVASPTFLEIVSGVTGGLAKRIMPWCTPARKDVVLLGSMEGLESVIEALLGRLYRELRDDDAALLCLGEEKEEAVIDFERSIYEELDEGDGVVCAVLENGGTIGEAASVNVNSSKEDRTEDGSAGAAGVNAGEENHREDSRHPVVDRDSVDKMKAGVSFDWTRLSPGTGRTFLLIDEVLGGKKYIIVESLPLRRTTLYAVNGEGIVEKLVRTDRVARLEIAERVNGSFVRVLMGLEGFENESRESKPSAKNRLAEEILKRFDPYGLMA